MKIALQQIDYLLQKIANFEKMQKEVLNFNAGPAHQSDELRHFLHMAQFDAKCITDTAREGVNILSLSHRDNPRTLKYLGIGFERDLLNPTIDRVYELYNLSREKWAVFFVPGGATQMFDMVAQNFGKNKTFACLDTGDFSKRFIDTIDKRLDINSTLFQSVSQLEITNIEISILIATGNATVEGFRISDLPEGYDKKVILDFTSNMLTEQIDWSKIKMAFGSTTKMLGTSGSTLVIVRKEALEGEKLEGTTKIANLQEQFKANGLLNTPSVSSILSAYYQTLVVQNKGGINAVNKECKKRSQILYDVIEESNGFYKANVEVDENKSIVNIVFSMESEELWNKFLDEAESIGITGLKGHKNLPLSIRASMYLDTPYEWAEILGGFMIKFFHENRPTKCNL